MKDYKTKGLRNPEKARAKELIPLVLAVGLRCLPMSIKGVPECLLLQKFDQAINQICLPARVSVSFLSQDGK